MTPDPRLLTAVCLVRDTSWQRTPLWPVSSQPNLEVVNSGHERLCSSTEWADHLARTILPTLAAQVDLGYEMLEIGAGFGAATDWLRHRVPRLTALEVDPTTATSLRIRFSDSNVSVVTGDCAACGFRDDSFDSVGCFTMLHHLPTASLQETVLAEVLRVLRPGGVLIGSDSLASDPLRLFHVGDTYNPVDPRWLSQALHTLGFVGISVRVAHEMTFIAHKATTGKVTHD
jgi:SAM-dependent methyltransferase